MEARSRPSNSNILCKTTTFYTPPAAHCFPRQMAWLNAPLRQSNASLSRQQTPTQHYRPLHSITDFYTALLSWGIPLENGYSPAQFLFGRSSEEEQKQINDTLCWTCWSNLECNSSETHCNSVLYLRHCPFDRNSI